MQDRVYAQPMAAVLVDPPRSDEELMREYISNGTPRMPGFRYSFEPAQIGAIVQYIKTVPRQPPPATAK